VVLSGSKAAVPVDPHAAVQQPLCRHLIVVAAGSPERTAHPLCSPDGSAPLEKEKKKKRKDYAGSESTTYMN